MIFYCLCIGAALVFIGKKIYFFDFLKYYYYEKRQDFFGYYIDFI